MQNRPDYRLYHLHELEAALAKIDESSNPEEAAIIKEYIEKGGYSVPTEPEVEAVRFINPLYKRTLVAVLATLFVLNLLALVSGQSLALVPLALQGVTLFMIFSSHKYTRGLIRIWSALLVISGFSGLLSMYYAPEIQWLKLAGYALTFTGGVLFFALVKKCIEPVLVDSDDSLNGDEVT